MDTVEKVLETLWEVCVKKLYKTMVFKNSKDGVLFPKEFYKLSTCFPQGCFCTLRALQWLVENFLDLFSAQHNNKLLYITL